ncbi:zinc finger RNA-binding protein isoform X3 [Plodia interpunctella]|uniref:zinc finger RNA-binding protein isoform X3 n=1 Tax=Plodia interpunctella TaxID=58824 RepID=UPI002368ABD2|nr:zinc finger RNA-binding protein isoform X3 [Plodia interpunctella]
MMAANNYFGFTHGGTQYGAATAGAAYGGQTGYAVAPAATAATYGTQRAAATGYDTAYQAAAATQAAHAHAHAAAAAASAYDASKSAYYQQAAAAYPAAAPPQPQPAYDTAAKPAYSTNATYTQHAFGSQTGARAGAGAGSSAGAKAYSGVYTHAHSHSATTPAASYPAQTYTAPQPQPQPHPPKQTANRGNTAYDTALYNAATMYVAQQTKTGGGGGWKNYNKGGVGAGQQRRSKPPPKAQQLHYCDVCRISCAGPQTYKEHLEGQKHKKKEAAVKLAAAGACAAATRAAGSAALRCELCDVTCTGADAYAAHVRGIKHQKVVKLHTMLGKPIPSTEPTKIGGAKKTVAGAPKIAFVASGGLSTVANKDAPADSAKEEDDDAEPEPEVQPVGQDYIEEIRGDDGKALSFNCKLCDCKFNDPNAKEMHMKGRRHRLQYKKKVQPDLEVKVKPSMHQRKLAEAKAQRMMVRDEIWARRRIHDGMEEEERGYWEGMEPWGWRGPPPHHHHHHHGMGMGMGMGFGPVGRRPETADDRHVLAKHAEIYPPEPQLQDIQRCVSHTEKALKSLSDALHAQNNKAKAQPGKATVKVEDKKDDKEGKEDGRDNQLFSFVGEGESTAAPNTSGTSESRALKGVMRVGLLAKGLLLKGDRDVQLVVLCHDRPTVTLLKRVAADLPAHLNKVKGPGDEPKYKVELQPAEGAVQVSDGNVNVLVSLTSAVMREPTEGGDVKRDDKDVLPRQKCLDALAALRHAKWFQARAASLQSCVIIIRIMRDLCRRIPNWTPLNPYAMELLVSGVMQSAGAALSPGEALRRVCEAVSGGLLLDHGPGLRDPCEKDAVDALGNLPPQKREDLTASAQQFLRQIAFRQIYKVLDMEPLPKLKHLSGGWKFPRKRRRSLSDHDNDHNGEGKVVKTEEKMDASENASGKK